MGRGLFRLPMLAGTIALLVLLAVPAQSPSAQGGMPRLAITAEPGSVPVGGTFRLVLTYTLPAGAKIGQVPEIRGIEGLSVVKREATGGRIVLTVLADSLDPVKVGPVELGYVGPDGKAGSLRSNALTVGVTSNLKGDGELKPIKGIIPTGHPWLWWAMVLGTALLALAALAGAFHAWRRWKGGGIGLAPVLAPHVRAERDLDALLKENLFEQGLQKEFYFRFTEIVKRYLEALRGFPAAECTTEEISARITDADRPLLSILRSADLVKFADEVASPGRKDDDVGAFLAYLDVTAPKPSEGIPVQEAKA
jgi:hypothetical protein